MVKGQFFTICTWEEVMNTYNLTIKRGTDGGLRSVVEPLASYICAAERPRAALLSAYKALLSEVEQTNRTARTHFSAIARGR
jgi:hypothetical protein